MTGTPGPPTTSSARLARVGAFVVIVLAGLSLVASLIAVWTGGPLKWQRLALPVGIGLLGFAMLIGPHRRGPYYTLLGVSFALSVLFFGFEILKW